MEQMPYQPEPRRRPVGETPGVLPVADPVGQGVSRVETARSGGAEAPPRRCAGAGLEACVPIVTSDWRARLPVLAGAGVTLRELEVADAPALLAWLTTDEVTRFISPPPTDVAGFERFIRWAQAERAAGRYVCFAVVPRGAATAVGLFQVRTLEPGWGTAEWGFALGSAFWGTGLFEAAARPVVDFVFDTLGVHRLEARAAVCNGRGTGALQKLGAVPEGVLRRAFLRHGAYLDQALYAILDEDWRQAKAVWGPSSH